MIIFDEEDKHLFLIEDLDLKAKAIRNSILPRLVLIIEELISKIIEIYIVDFYSDSSIVKSPNFRNGTNRTNLRVDYSYAIAGFSGVRKKNKWHAVKKNSQEVASVIPIRLELILDYNGIRLFLHNQYLNNFTNNIHKAYIEFLIDNCDMVQSLLQKAHCSQLSWFDNDKNFISSYKDNLAYSLQNNWNEIQIESQCVKYPIDDMDKEELIHSVITIFPIYESFINISKGESDGFNKRIEQLNKWKWATKENYKEGMDFRNDKIGPIIIENAQKLADTKIKIMPSKRWQVFQRDNWKCVSCGRTSDDGIILHVDHIIPRSKGGLDLLNNYQTLCNICNIGKSNKDETNIKDR